MRFYGRLQRDIEEQFDAISNETRCRFKIERKQRFPSGKHVPVEFEHRGKIWTPSAMLQLTFHERLTEAMRRVKAVFRNTDAESVLVTITFDLNELDLQVDLCYLQTTECVVDSLKYEGK